MNMNNKYMEWIQANVFGLFGCLYLPKKGSKANIILIEVAPIVIYTIIAMATISFFATILSCSNLEFVKGLTEVQKYWIGVRYGFVYMFVIYFFINIYRWFTESKTEYQITLYPNIISPYAYSRIKTEKFICKPFISWKKYNELYNIKFKEEKIIENKKREEEQNIVENQLERIIKYI